MTPKHPKGRSSKLRNLGIEIQDENLPQNPAIPTKPLTTFSLFPLLPAELRLKIYRHATLPRLIRLPPPCTVRIIPPLDPLLHTCSSSRYEVQNSYISTSAPLPLCFKPGFDTVCLTNYRDAEFLTSLIGSGIWGHVRYLAVGKRFWEAVLGREVLGRKIEGRGVYERVRNARYLRELRIVDEGLGDRIVEDESEGVGERGIVDTEYGGFEGAERWVRIHEGKEQKWVKNTKERVWENWDREVGFVMDEIEGRGREVPDVKFARVDGVRRGC